MKLIDLHVHSTASDGTLSPRELALYAKAKGLSAIALTDHDTVNGIDECTKEGLRVGVIVVPGIEFSADFHGKEVHILGYYFNPHHPKLINKFSELTTARAARNNEILEKLASLGMPLTLEDCLRDAAPGATITRAHIAKALLEKGYIKERREAFDRYITPGKPAYVPKKNLTVKECTSLIHEAGGLAVLAHPFLYGYDRKDMGEITRGLVSEGIDGMECIYSTHSKEDIAFLLQLCLKHKLFPTGGSDFHGANKPLLDLGSGYGELEIPFDILEAMRERLGLLT